MDSPVLPILPGRVLLSAFSCPAGFARGGFGPGLRRVPGPAISVPERCPRPRKREQHFSPFATRECRCLSPASIGGSDRKRYPRKYRATLVSAKRATTIRVSLVRFFSMIVVPEKVPPIPPPSEEERPPPLPECRSMSPMRAMQNTVWQKASTYTMRLLYHTSLGCSRT